ncbi:MAG: TonB-dependent receptor, partial [Pseudomonadota bacterium]
ADLSNVNFLQADNRALISEDINEAEYTGVRISGLWDINDNWTLLVSHQTQDIESDGVFFADPDLDDLQIQRYANDRIEDNFSNTSWTLEGMIGELEVVYTGAFTDRETDQIVDYSDYLFVGQYLPYYICDASVTYPGAGVAPSGTCQAPNLFVDSRTRTETLTHEVRFLTDASRPWRVTAGAFFSDLELAELNDFNYPGSVNVIGFDGVSTGFAPNFPLTNVDATGPVGNAAPGYFSDPGPFPQGVIFRNDVLRTDKQTGIFGEVTFDLNDEFSLLLGMRWYDIEVDLEGSANSSFSNLGGTTDAQAFGTNISAQFAPNNTVGAPDTASTDGTIFKVTLDWRPTDDHLLFATVSEGFRPGLLNRPGGAAGPNNFTVPFALDTDEVTNIEFGTKSSFFSNTLQLNSSLFFVDIERLQTTIFDPSITNLFFSDNAADAEVRGIEGNFIWLPQFSDGWTITGAFSFLDTEITDVITPTNDVQVGDELAFAPGFQANIRARYEWGIGNQGWLAHIMPSLSYSDEAFSDIVTINRNRMDSWMIANVTAGVTTDTWSAELFVSNLTDERAEVANSFVFDASRVTYSPPRTIGVRLSWDF